MNEADYAALGEHLHEVRPIFDAYCERYGFRPVDPMTLGRYPRIRIERPGPVKIWFDLWMELDGDGRRYETFWRGAPYELSTGAHFDVSDGSRYGVRFQKALACFSAMPFERVGAVLMAEMETYLVVVQRWDEAYLRRDGIQVQLGTGVLL